MKKPLTLFYQHFIISFILSHFKAKKPVKLYHIVCKLIIYLNKPTFSGIL